MKNFIIKVEEHFKEWGGRYTGSFFLTMIVYSFIPGNSDSRSNDNFLFLLFIIFAAVTVTYNFGYEKAKDKFFKPEPSDDEIRIKYGRMIEIISQIVYSPVAYPEFFLPYPKEKIRKVLEDEIKIVKMVMEFEKGDVLEKHQKYLESLESCLWMLDGAFINDDEAIKKNKYFKDLLLKARKNKNAK